MLISEGKALVAGATNNIALTFDIDEGWHVYWPGQNDTGFAPTVELTLPEGWVAGEIQWPAPHRYIAPGNILDHIYEDGEATFIIPITIPEDTNPGPVRLTADLEWLVCREACIPGWETVTLETSVAPKGARIAPSEHAERFAKARERHPEPIVPDPHPRRQQPARWATLSWQEGSLRIAPAVPPRSGGSETDIARPVSIAFYPDAKSSPIKDLLNRGESRGLGTGDDTRPPAPLRLEREDPSKPISGIVEVRFLDRSRPALYRIDTRPLGEQPPQSSKPDAGPED